MIHLIGLAVVALGVVFFVLAARRIKKRLYWIGACRCRAQVSRADYRIVRDEQGDIESQNSSAAVTMAFACRGTSYTVKKSFDKALDAPRTGEWLKIFYRPDTDEWIFCREVRPWWTLQLLSGAVFVTVGAVVAAQGWDFLAQLNGFTMEQQNLASTMTFLAVTYFCFLFSLVSVLFLMPMGLQPLVRTLGWLARKMLGRLEEIPAQCMGCIVYSDSESHDDYPLFCCETLQGTVYWLCRQSRNPRCAGHNAHPLPRQQDRCLYALPGEICAGTDAAVAHPAVVRVNLYPFLPDNDGGSGCLYGAGIYESVKNGAERIKKNRSRPVTGLLLSLSPKAAALKKARKPPRTQRPRTGCQTASPPAHRAENGPPQSRGRWR